MMSFEMPVNSTPEESTTTNLEQASFPPEICDSMHNDVIYTTEPMPFIQSVANGKLLVNPRAHDMLSRIEKPLVVISIAGLYRTGMYNVMYVWASIPKVVGSNPTVVRHIFQACPVWIYTQSSNYIHL